MFNQSRLIPSNLFGLALMTLIVWSASSNVLLIRERIYIFSVSLIINILQLTLNDLVHKVIYVIHHHRTPVLYWQNYPVH